MSKEQGPSKNIYCSRPLRRESEPSVTPAWITPYGGPEAETAARLIWAMDPMAHSGRNPLLRSTLEVRSMRLIVKLEFHRVLLWKYMEQIWPSGLVVAPSFP